MLRRRVDAARLDEAITRASESLVALAAPRRALGLRARSRRDDPVGVHPAPALSRPYRAGAASAHRPVHPRNPRSGRRLAAVPRRRARYQRLGQGLFRTEGGRRSGRRAAYGAGPRGDPGARRGAALQRVHAHPAGAVRRGAVAGGAGHAGRDHAAAELVSVSHRQGIVLVAHRARAAARADGAAPAGPQPARASRSASCFVEPPEAVRDWIRRSDLLAAVGGVRHARPAVAGRRAVLPGGFAAASDRQSRRLCHRAPQRRGWPRRHLPGDGQRRDDVRLPRLRARSPRLRDGSGLAAQAARARRRAQLLPALPLAGVGYGAGLPCADGGRRQPPRTRRSGGRSTGSRAKQVLEVVGDWAAARPGLRPGGWAFQFENPLLPRSRRHRGGRARPRPLRLGALSASRSTGPPSGSSACRAGTADGAPSTPTTRIII